MFQAASASLVLAVLLGLSPGVCRGSGSVIATGSSQEKVFTASDLVSGAGSDFKSSVLVGVPFTIRVSSTGPCIVWVRRSNAAWVRSGHLMIAIKRNGVFGQPIQVNDTDVPLLSSASALNGDIYELQYSVQKLSIATAPGTYVADVTFTVTDN
ncbi:hypothetical protein DB347_04955 [Opitutaceae bacterium EW11]|nr:hypothetical protein DB347_04955 [Opitutaceae bacterium EW11]